MELFTWARLQWDRALGILSMIPGVVIIGIGWIGVANTPYIAKQVPYVVSGGIGGLALLIIGGTLWLSADMNDEWRVLDRLEQDAQDHGAADDELTSLRERVRALEVLTQQPANGLSQPAQAGNGGARRARTSA
jgi:hypothetical protein